MPPPHGRGPVGRGCMNVEVLEARCRMAFAVVSSVLVSALAPKPASPQQPAAFAIDSVRGVPRVTNLAESPSDLPQFVLREVWRVGGVKAEEGGQFIGPFFAVALDSLGQAWVLDNRASELTLFDSQGRYIRTVARSGPGPSEIFYPTGLSLGPGGHVWVEGAIDGYYKVFDLAGDFVRSLRFDPHSTNGPMRPFWVGTERVLDHARGYPTIKFFRTDTLATPIDSFSLKVPEIGTGGILRPGTVEARVAWLRPFLRWTIPTGGASIWLARTDTLGLTQVSVHGDTLRRVEARHRTPSFTKEQRKDIRLAEHRMRNPGNFAPVLVQAVHGIDGGRLLVQIGRDPTASSSEFDLYGANGVLQGVVHSTIPMHNQSELSSRGDTILFMGVGEYDVPILVKAVLERRRR